MKVETIAEQLFFSTVRIEATGPNKASTGTSFLFTYKVGDGVYPFLVTNKHVVAGTEHGRFFLTRRRGDGAPDIGNAIHVQLDQFERRWFGHPQNDVDVCVMPLAPLMVEIRSNKEEVFTRSIPREFIPDQKQLDDLDAIEDVMFLGYPNGIFDRKNLIPVARRGATATPIQLDYEGTPAFLIDASVFPGSSGSPVFIVNMNGYRQGNTFMMGASRIYFVGVIARVHLREQLGQLRLVTIPTAQVPVVTSEEMLDLGVVFKARTVIETVEVLLRKTGDLPSNESLVGAGATAGS